MTPEQYEEYLKTRFCSSPLVIGFLKGCAIIACVVAVYFGIHYLKPAAPEMVLGPPAKHLLVEYKGCSVKLLKDADYLQRILQDVAADLELTIVETAFHRINLERVVGMLLLTDAHLSIHTWPEEEYAAVDIYTTGGNDPAGVLNSLGRSMGCETIEHFELFRNPWNVSTNQWRFNRKVLSD
jgi:S-adenosylmethionine decarboxylase proenzyme